MDSKDLLVNFHYFLRFKQLYSRLKLIPLIFFQILEVPLNIAKSISKLLVTVHVKTLDSERLTNQEIQICVPSEYLNQISTLRNQTIINKLARCACMHL